uniref:Uncharacterized protein n=1 Tax=Rhizophora mucronata TaxID=61149 RepID=A0A2P2NWL2_RHIMU
MVCCLVLVFLFDTYIVSSNTN